MDGMGRYYLSETSCLQVAVWTVSCAEAFPAKVAQVARLSWTGFGDSKRIKKLAPICGEHNELFVVFKC